MSEQKSQDHMRNEFRFVVAGIELPKDHREQLANAVAEAGMQALASLDLGGDRAVAHFMPREWLGRYLQVLQEDLTRELEQKLDIVRDLGR
jgi:hypothetical protein